jgi:phosphatidate phosphatase PAH1
MKYIVDIDGTICEQMSNFKYGEGKVLYDRIEHLNKLYDEGNQIIYYTARGMGEFDGSYRLSNKKWYNITEKQLKNWGAK